jgi:hypothetical protein
MNDRELQVKAVALRRAMLQLIAGSFFLLDGGCRDFG